MNASDAFRNGSLTFEPSKEIRTRDYISLVFFGLFFLFGLTPVFFGGEKGHAFFLFLSSISSLCFGGMGIWCYLLMRTSRDPVVLDREDLSIGSRRYQWNDIQRLSERTSPERSLTLYLSSGERLPIRIVGYRDGEEMRRLITALVPSKPFPEEGEELFRLEGASPTLFALAIYLFMSVGLGLFQLSTPKPPHAIFHPAILTFGLVPVLLAVGVHTLTRFVRLNPREITSGSALSRRSIPLALVDQVTESADGLAVRSGQRNLLLPRRLERYAELRERLLALSPRGAAEPALSNQASTDLPLEPRVFRAKPFAWLGYLVGGIFCTALGVSGVVMAIQGMARSPGMGALLLLVCLIPTSLGIFGFLAAIESRTRIEVDEKGIGRRSLLRPAELDWDQVEAAWRSGNEGKGYVLQGQGKKIEIDPEFVQDMPALAAILDAHLPEANARAIRSAEGETFGPDSGTLIGMVGVLGFFGVLLMVMAFTTGSWVQTERPGDEAASIVLRCIFFFGGVLMLFLSAMIGVRRYVVCSDGLEVRTLRGTRFVRWSEIRRAESGIQTGNRQRSSQRFLALEYPGGTLRLDAMTIGQFERLRGYILSKVDPAVIRSSE